MKRCFLVLVIGAMLLQTSCSTSKLTKGEMYSLLYEENPVSILVMPPINTTDDIEAADLLYSTLNHSIAEAGYYVIPPIIAKDVFEKEGVIHSELFIDAPLNKFNEYFGADAVLFTVINDWSRMEWVMRTEVRYILKSTISNEVLFDKVCKVQFDNGKGYVSFGSSPFMNFLADVSTTFVSLLDAALSNFFETAEFGNHTALADLPSGKYDSKYKQDMDVKAKKYKISKYVRD